MSSTYAQRERLLLADLFDTVGPDAPTLCEGWNTRELLVHLVVRERRADAYLGGLIKPLAARGERIQEGFRSQPFEELVRTFRFGPPRMSPLSVARVDELANTAEFFVHSEDVRRAQQGWSPRTLDEEFSDVLWRRLAQMGRVLSRKAPVGLVLRRPNGETLVARKGTPVVTVFGEPSELMLFTYGRAEHARVETEGEQAAVDRLRVAKLGM